MRRLLLPLVWAALCLGAAADETKPALKEFVSKEGGFPVLLPKDPVVSKVPEEGSKDGAIMQYQFIVNQDNGVYIVSYQDNANLQNAGVEKLEQGLLAAQDKVRAGFGGKVLRSNKLMLDKVYPGLDYECDVPAGPGIYRSRSYLVNTRLYQLIAVGTKEFATGAEVSQVFDSFKLAK